MHCVHEISPNIYWVGGNDRRLERFENMFPLPNGVSYNSYLIMDEKTALIDTVDEAISALYLENVTHVLGSRKLDYLVINHMEPDHCANIEEIVRRFPEIQVIGNPKTFQYFRQYYSLDMSSNYLEVNEGQEISLGEHTLRFYMAPMVHWPEVMFTYEISKGVLFAADAFGSFGAISGNLFADEVEFDNVFLDEARRYYSNIVGRYGSQVQAILKKLAGAEINMLCSLHGLIWRGDKIPYILDKYDKWSRYLPEKKGVVLIYASMYGNTENAMNALAIKLSKRGVKDMRMYDVSKTHPSYIISDIWKYSHMVIGSPTYNMHLYFVMDSLLRELAVLGIKNRKAALIGNHTWSSSAIKGMLEIVEGMKGGVEVIGTPLDIRSTLKPEREPELDELADAIYASLIELED
ncbi:FprA family A-type flavoprotein [Mobilitalea sibirica]|uniref:FprA family A-type flavoprotein n=1 Tax=Mobilitalea sibirica TaxID=1462919 RepID=A0A8J7H5U2_9FIRM|nr:FprA family A-type flavoprotein [Mobilitalea sibirica]MBH1941849.1 FprA family A-type flavoprotein [Mobilitalea sibirica]